MKGCTHEGMDDGDEAPKTGCGAVGVRASPPRCFQEKRKEVWTNGVATDSQRESQGNHDETQKEGNQ